MKKSYFPTLLFVFLFMILVIPANAQDKEQKKMHVTIEENGTVITDTTVFFNKEVSEEEIQAVISGITGEKNRPCQAHFKPAMHCDTIGYKCKHMQKSELDSLLEASGKPFTYTPSDSCRHVHVSCVKNTEKVKAHQDSCKHAEKEIIRIGESAGKESVIIEENGDVIIRKGHHPGEKCIKIIIESDGDTVVSEKVKEIRIIENRPGKKGVPEGCSKQTIEKKIIITEEGDKAEKAIITDSPADTEKKAKKEN